MIGMLIVQDLAVVPMMVILPQLNNPTIESATLGFSALKAGGFITGMILLGTRLLPRLMAHIAKLGSRELFLLAITAIGLGVGYATYLVGLSFAFGAFVAGMVLSESDYGHQALSDIIPLRDLFGLLFFASVGMLLDPAFILDHLRPVAVLVLAVGIGKGLIFALIARIFKYGNVIPLAIGLGLFQIGEFSFVLARVGVSTGSIGSELCRQILTIGPEKLLLIEQSEFALYAIHQELEERLANKEIKLVPLLASVQDDERMHEIMSTWRPDTVYHAAAYKHVPLVEHNPAEGIKNNVLGTLKAAKAAAANDVSDFVLISTDKAVRPTNIMGASKRLAEMTLQALAADNPGTKFSMVRFGNVLGSSGSVVPKFRQQIRDGGPITLTHPEITRYFMTIPEAAQLVIQAGAMAKGGDVFVLDMGQSVKIMDLARRMIELSGLTVKIGRAHV